MTDVIAVLGATGRTGCATTRYLLDRGATVRALTRDPDAAAARTLGSAGADVRPADMEDPESLRAALVGVTRLFNVQPAFDSRGRYRRELELAQGSAAAGAAAAAGVTHVVQLAAATSRPTGVPHLDSKLEIRKYFENAGIPVSYLCPGPFMELMVDPSFSPALSTWGAEPRVVGWDRPMPWVAVDDIGRTAAELLTAPAPSSSHDIHLIGDVRSLRDCLGILTEVGHAPRRLPFPFPVTALRALLGPELPAMWRWAAEYYPPDAVVSPGLLDVPGWAARLTTSSASRKRSWASLATDGSVGGVSAGSRAGAWGQSSDAAEGSPSAESVEVCTISATGTTGIATDSIVVPQTARESADSIGTPRDSASGRDWTGSDGSPAHSVGSSGRVVN